ncbi:helix-turn-helix domain-containing protein [Ichthyenterobacterium magnum]|uniref:AraC family transcriptional regulator n=1 Tax=Ichthyenterobacterium magnum TaxID=1230530 RepID=A0A420DKS1_9FLAO|nr:helix-turn-helix domain-containing protein [Ichthyenterobacterium magnum]RKE94788.1 AraC family transcriptional regulator [Ichthyenterobacterium magnum]
MLHLWSIYFSMNYFQKKPSSKLSSYIKEFWQIEGNGFINKKRDKIIPDGYPELIFHYKDAYKSNINKTWNTQSKYLIAGQIKNHFYIENTGETGMFGIKFQPAALTKLFSINMALHTDKVTTLDSYLFSILKDVITNATSETPFEEKVNAIEIWFNNFVTTHTQKPHIIDKAIEIIMSSNGATTIKDITRNLTIGERTLERYFKTYVGLSPKFFCRIIRFSHIFKIVSDSKNWTDVTYQTGYYDQSHFIKNFKEFTGEDPSKYGFNAINMANFFLNKP